MTITGPRYFWQRPAWLIRLVLGSLVAAGLLAMVTGGLAAAAQRTADQLLPSEHYSLSMHVLAMTAVGALAVGVASALATQGRPWLAGIVLAAAALGPMTVVATPVRGSLVTPDSQDTALWWHVAVAAVLIAILGAWTLWAAHCLRERQLTPTPGEGPELSPLTMLPDLLFVVTAGVGLVIYLNAPEQSNPPALRAIVGWVMLAAGIVVAVGFARLWWTSLLAALAAGTVLGLVFLAYSRLGGWPGVAGWEYNGMESPIITSVATTATVLAAWAVGLMVWAVRQSASRVMVRHSRRHARAI
jgi:hypothetical protein